MSTSFLCEIYYILLATGVTTIVYHNNIKESDLTFRWCANLYRTNELSSFVVTVWDIDMLKECVKLD